MAAMFVIVLALASLAPSLGQAPSIALLAYSIHRHGSRTALPKTITNQESSALDGTTLLPQGQRLCYNAGQNYRARYITPATCSQTGTCLQPDPAANGNLFYGMVQQTGFSNFNTLIRASYLDRTALSAESVIAGLFPADGPINSTTLFVPDGQAMVPIYMNEGSNDWLLRPQVMCNTYNNILLNWFNSSQFLAKSAESAPLRNYLSSLAPSINTALDNFWNVFDEWNTYQTFGLGTPLPILNATIFNELEQLAYWLEVNEMNSSLVHNYVGGPLLGDMLEYMDSAIELASSGVVNYYKLMMMSTEYLVQLGVLAALAMDKYAPAVNTLNWLSTKVPSVASMMVFELLAPSDGISGSTGSVDPTSVPGVAVRLMVQDGPAAAWLQVPMPCSVVGDAAEQLAGAGSCTYANFRKMAAAAAMTTAEEWCTACANTQAPDCEVVMTQASLTSTQQQLEQALATINSTTACGCSNSEETRLRKGLAAGVVVAFFVGLALAFAISYFVAARYKKGWATKSKDYESTYTPPN